MDRYGRTTNIANLFVCDGSILPTQGSANPGLTIQALAARTADYLISQGERIFTFGGAGYDSPAGSYPVGAIRDCSRGIPGPSTNDCTKVWPE